MAIKVYNPHPCLVNVATGDGGFVRIPPLGTAEVEEKSVAAFLKSGKLQRAGGDHSSVEAEDTRESKRSPKV